MRELIVATRNKKKLAEIKEILKDLNLKINSLIEYPNAPIILEDKKTFKENAIKKAKEIARFTKKLTLGEDSGLEVSALGGKPGIYSATFAGEEKDDLKNNLKLLELLEGLPLKKRKAKFICALALADKDGLLGVAEGMCSGVIGFKLKGNSGFGYDPLFIPHLSEFPRSLIKGKNAGFIISKYKKTFAQLGPKIKNKMSHRYRALQKIKKIIQKYIEEQRLECYNLK